MEALVDLKWAWSSWPSLTEHRDITDKPALVPSPRNNIETFCIGSRTLALLGPVSHICILKICLEFRSSGAALPNSNQFCGGHRSAMETRARSSPSVEHSRLETNNSYCEPGTREPPDDVKVEIFS